MPDPASNPQSRNPGKTAMTVLAIRQGDQRDLLLAIGALKAISEAHPRAKLTLVTSPLAEAFAKVCPFVDEVISDLEHEDKRRRAGRVAELKRTDFDMIYDLDGDGRSASLFQALKPRFGPPPPWSGPAPGAPFPTPDRISGANDVEHLSAVLASAGAIQNDTQVRPDLTWVRPVLGDPPRLQPEYFGIKGAFAVIALPAAKPDTPLHWPKNEIAELCKRLSEAKVTPVLTGERDAGLFAQDVEMRERSAKNLVARADTTQLIGLVEKSCVAIGPDGFAMQAAGLMGTPCILLRADTATFAPQDPPLTPQKIILHDDTLSTITADTILRTMSIWNLFPNTRES